MEQREIDKLVSDIQNYLTDVGEQAPFDATDRASQEQDMARAGLFISTKGRTGMGRFLKYSQLASYAVELLTIGLFTAGVISPFPSWPMTLMFLMGVLLFGIFSVTVLISLQARIRLLLRIEESTKRVARSKERIAAALERIQTD